MKVYVVEASDGSWDRQKFYPTLLLARKAARVWADDGVEVIISEHEIGHLSSTTLCRVASGEGWSMGCNVIETIEAE